MSSNVLFFGWGRSIPGREQLSGAHFGEFAHYLGGLQQEGTIQSFEAVFLDVHGGDLNGFFLIRGESAKLDVLASSVAWIGHMIRADLHLQGAGMIRGVTGDLVMERMNTWMQAIPI